MQRRACGVIPKLSCSQEWAESVVEVASKHHGIPYGLEASDQTVKCTETV